jgi:hypothetical protein
LTRTAPKFQLADAPIDIDHVDRIVDDGIDRNCSRQASPAGVFDRSLSARLAHSPLTQSN